MYFSKLDVLQHLLALTFLLMCISGVEFLFAYICLNAIYICINSHVSGCRRAICSLACMRTHFLHRQRAFICRWYVRLRLNVNHYAKKF